MTAGLRPIAHQERDKALSEPQAAASLLQPFPARELAAMRKNFPVKVWRERISPQCYALNACCIMISGGWVRGFATFVLVEHLDPNYFSRAGWRQRGEEWWREQLTAHCYGILPRICRVDAPGNFYF